MTDSEGNPVRLSDRLVYQLCNGIHVGRDSGGYLIGREQEVKTICALLQSQQVRLITLKGTAGVGKTRLAHAIAVKLRASFLHGIYFIPLATIKDPELFLPAIAHLFSLDDGEGQQLLARLKAYLSDKHLLLVFDSFEQVLPVASSLGELLVACPYIKALATSRERLHIDAEHIFPVLPLEQRDRRQLLDLASPCAAVRLFMHYAQRSKPDFHRTKANMPAIAELCVCLHGIPLAIELAATQVKYLSLPKIVQQLEQQPSKEEQVTRDTACQRSLYDVVKWVYGSLETEEQQLFRVLSIFCGGCTLEALEAVWRKVGGNAATLPALLQSLLERHLLYRGEQGEGEPRLYMLEALRVYGTQCLRTSCEVKPARNAHVEYYIELAEAAKLALKRGGQSSWLERLQMEQDNLREAFRWMVAQEEVEGALRLGGALWHFWYTCGYSNEGRRWLEQAVRCRPVASSPPLETVNVRQSEGVQGAIVVMGYTPVSSPLQQLPTASALLAVPEKLTQREVEVLRLVSLGHTNDEIARQLVISSRTVHAHLRSIYSKLGITSRSAATRYAITHQLT